MKNHFPSMLFAGLIVSVSISAQTSLEKKIQEYRNSMSSSSSMSGGNTALLSPGYSLPLAGMASGSGSFGAGTFVLDKAIDSNTYVLGPGDKLTAYIWGTTEKTLELSVGGEGAILIPLMAVVDVKGLTLTQAKQRVHEVLLKNFKNVNILITLSEVRTFKTFVTGEVENPGAILVTGAARVSDVIEMAGGFKHKQQRRGVQILGDSGIVGLADLTLFANTGDLAGNPYIAEGQRVHVLPRTQNISVFGEVNFQGGYDFTEGDDLGLLIRVAGGLTRNGDSSHIILTRFPDDGGSLVTTELSLFSDATYPLRKDDRIMVCRRSDYRLLRNVAVEGEVNFPGTYPIEKDKTHLKDLIEMAGGLTDMAFREGSYVLRTQFNRKLDGKTDPERMLRVMDAAKIDPANIPQSELSYIKSDYMETEGKMSIDFGKALSSDNDPNNIILRDDDRVFIARKELTVRVMGSVVSPGQISHSPDRRFEYYLNLAGGFNRNAKKSEVLIRKVGSDTWTRVNGQSIDPGDVILVPERKYRDGFNVFRDGLAIAASVATIIISAITIATYVNP